MYINYDEYSTDDLTKKQQEFINGIAAALDDINDLMCEKCEETECDDSTLIERMRAEIACETLAELKETIESHMCGMIVAMVDENVAKVLDMPRKKAEKKYGKRFVREVLDE